MSFRERLAMNVAPVPLRLVLAVTFIWAGSVKVFTDMEVQGEQAAILANLGVDLGVAQSTQPTAFQDGVPAIDRIPPPPAEDEPESEAEQPAPSERTPRPAARYTARDFPQPIAVKKLYGLALLMHGAANPEPFEDGSARPRIWPDAIGSTSGAVIMAWLAAVSEVLLGFAVLIGFLTRLHALGLFGVMLTATWLTEIGLAIQNSATVIGFLPSYPLDDIPAWKTLFWQLSLAAAAAALFLTGPGAASIDRLLFQPKKAKGGEDDDDEWDDEEDEEYEE